MILLERCLFFLIDKMNKYACLVIFKTKMKHLGFLLSRLYIAFLKNLFTTMYNRELKKVIINRKYAKMF